MHPVDPSLRWHPARDEFLTPWSHVSGWKYLDGNGKTVTCVIPCLNQRRHLTLLLPQIKDVLNESGFHWEVLLIDAGSDDGTVPLLRHWCAEAGFRMAASNTPMHRAQAIVTGLSASQGHATILMDANARYRMSLLRQAILRWSEGEQFVVAKDECKNRILELDAAAPGSAQMLDARDFGQAVGGFVLIDRCLVQTLLENI